MKHLLNLYEAIIIVLLIAVLLVPEMIYFAVDRAIEKVREVAGKYKNTIENIVSSIKIILERR